MIDADFYIAVITVAPLFVLTVGLSTDGFRSLFYTLLGFTKGNKVKAGVIALILGVAIFVSGFGSVATSLAALYVKSVSQDVRNLTLAFAGLLVVVTAIILFLLLLYSLIVEGDSAMDRYNEDEAARQRRIGADIVVCHGRDGAPGVAEVESLYFAAFHGKPLYETQETASHYAQLYGSLVSQSDFVTVFIRKYGELGGLAYGHPWRWAEQADARAAQLRDRLGFQAAASLEGGFAVYLLAVHPDYRRWGFGRLLLRRLLEAAGTERAWLITRDEPTSAAMALFKAEGWKPIGHGPDTPNGKPGLALIKG